MSHREITGWIKINGNAQQFSESPHEPERFKELADPVWLIPDKATLVEPPAFNEKTHRCAFDEDEEEWVLTEIPSEEEASTPQSTDMSLPGFVPPEWLRIRNEAYPTTEQQWDMQYWDLKNDTTVWKDTIEKIKTDNPKTSVVKSDFSPDD